MHFYKIDSGFQMKVWRYTKEKHEMNREKMNYMQRHYPEFEAVDHWNYEVFLHRCGFEGRLEKPDARALLQMLRGPMYSEEAFVAMETPLLDLLVSLRAELEATNPERYWQYDKKWFYITDQMNRVRDSSHRKLKEGVGRKNEYIAFFQHQQN